MALDVGTLQFNLVGNVASFISSMGAANAAVLGVGAVVGATAFVIGSSLKTYEEFETALTQVKITTKATNEELMKIEETIREQAKVTKFTATETATAYNYLALAGLSVKEATQALPIVLQTATAANLDLARTSDLLTDSVKAAGLEISSMGNVANVFLAISQNANTNMEQLMEAFIITAPRAKILGQELDTTAAMLGILADNGVKASEGGHKAERALRQLAKTGGEGEKVLKELGVAIYDNNGTMRQADQIFMDLNAALSGYSDEQKNAAMQTIFGSTAMQGGSILMSASAEDWRKLKVAAQESGGGIEAAAEQFANTIEGKKLMVKSAFQELQLIIGEQFAPAFLATLDGMIQILLKLGETIEPVMQKMGSIFNDITSGIEVDGDLLKKIVDGIIQLFYTLKDVFDIVWGFVRDNLLPIVSDYVKALEENLLPILSDIAGMILENLVPAFESLASFLEENVVPIIERLMSVINDTLLPVINDLWSHFKEKIIPLLQEFWAELEEKVLPKVEEFSAGLDGLIKELQRLWEVIEPIVLPILKLLLEMFVKIAGYIITNFLSNLMEIVNFLTERFTGTIKTVNDKLQAMKDKFEEIKTIIETVTIVFNLFKKNAIDMVLNAFDTFIAKIKIVIDKISELKEKLSGGFGNAMAAVSGAIGNIGGRSAATPALAGVGINNNMERSFARTTGSTSGNGSGAGSQTTNQYYINQTFDSSVSQRDIEIGTKQALSSNEQIKEGVQ